ncbi:divalent metal cation transporter [Congregicoccus parvus]|uniref:divalent metal cation transporter n=1 Tax=Congregicoccus parvus TaxID=3081749 RepID=UPI003FA561C5
MPLPSDDPTRSTLLALTREPMPRRLLGYARLSGPGWLQSAITLGGGSLSSSLYVGVVGGFGLLWVQPLAMVVGIIMLAAIAYVTVSTGRRTFGAINEHVSPVLGWGWALGTLAVSMVWVMPQYTLAVGVLRQNLLPGLLGEDGTLGSVGGRIVPTAAILAVSLVVVWQYGRGGAGVRLFEGVLKVMVAVIVICFLAVAVQLSVAGEGFDWGAVFAGFVPGTSFMREPAAALAALIEATPAAHHAFWTDLVVQRQREVVISGAAYAVGINMTFLFPYSLLRRGWGREGFGLVRFDLVSGMLIPFMLATSAVVVAASSRFHAQPHPALIETSAQTVPARIAGEFRGMLAASPAGVDGASEADRYLAATLVTRDAFDLARALEPLTGTFLARLVFGLGVLGMTLSTVIIIMLICGFVVCEILGREHKGWPLRLGSLFGLTGVLGPFVWSKASFWLAVPASVFGLMLLPVAYLAFMLLANRAELLGDAMPRGGTRVAANVLMGGSVALVTAASLYVIWMKGGTIGLVCAGVFAVAVILTRRRRGATA